MRRPAAGAGWLVALLHVSSAQAQVPPPDGGAPVAASLQTFDRGVEALRSRRFAEAIVFLEEVHGRDPSALTRYNLGLALRGVGRYGEAITLFEAYLAAPESTASPERLAALRVELEHLRRSRARLTISLRPPAARLQVDGRAVEPVDGMLTLDPGAHVFEASHDGYATERRELVLQGGSQSVFELELRRRLPSRIALTPVPASAVLRIDGVVVGRGPIEREVPPGSYRVQASAEGHVGVERVVRVEPEGVARVELRLLPEARPRPAWVIPAVVAGGVAIVAGVVAAAVLLSQPVEGPPTGWGSIREAVMTP